ncbi:MAG: hypothetical protein WKF89_05110 [Chitinophagaceae bacterium]
MKTAMRLVYLIACLNCLFVLSIAQSVAPNGDIALADPAILYFKGTYYLYGSR